MPSGSKKRKAIKKKMEKQANSHLGDVQEERESDGGETNSPMSQDQHNHQHFAEGEDSSSIQSAATEGESVEGVNGNGNSFDKVAVEEKSDILVNREIKLEDDLEPNKVTIEHIEFEKKSSSSSSSSSSSRSSSDDESKFVDKNIEVINWEEPIEYSPNLPAEAAAIVDLEKTSDLPEITQVNDVTSHNLAVVTPDEESYKTVPVVDDHDLAVAKSKVEISDPQVHLIEDLDLKVNGKDKNSEVSSTVIDMGSQSMVAIVSTKDTVVEEVVSKMLPQSSVPAVDTVNGTEHKKVSEIESPDRQTPVALPPRPVQTTSLMGCCGLFELFKGSNR